jgi:hypothetical protein
MRASTDSQRRTRRSAWRYPRWTRRALPLIISARRRVAAHDPCDDTTAAAYDGTSRWVQAAARSCSVTPSRTFAVCASTTRLVSALPRPLPERGQLLVEQAGDPADIGPWDPQPERRDERLLAALALLQEARVVAALAHRGNLQLDLTRTRVSHHHGRAAAAMRRTVLRALAMLRTGDERLHPNCDEPAPKVRCEGDVRLTPAKRCFAPFGGERHRGRSMTTPEQQR